MITVSELYWPRRRYTARQKAAARVGYLAGLKPSTLCARLGVERSVMFRWIREFLAEGKE